MYMYQHEILFALFVHNLIHLIFLLQLLQSPGNIGTLVLVHNLYTRECFLVSFRPGFYLNLRQNPSGLAWVQKNTVQSQPSPSKYRFHSLKYSVPSIVFVKYPGKYKRHEILSVQSPDKTFACNKQHMSAVTS